VKFSIVHPTARLHEDFQHPWWKACASAADNCDNPSDVEYILVVHQSRRDMLNGLAQFSKFGRFAVVTNYGRDCLVDQSNAGVAAASGEIILGNQDDMRYPPHWDSDIRKLIADTSQLVCVQANTEGARRDLLCIPTIATRALVYAIGAASPEYDGMYSDDEWSAKARSMGVVIQSDLRFEHHHFTQGKSDIDSVYAQENAATAYETGRRVFLARQAAGFPRIPFGGELPLPAPMAIRRPERIIALCTPGESHRVEWERAFFTLCAALMGGGWTVRYYPGYSTNVYHTRASITLDVMKDAKETGTAPELVLWIDDDNTPSVESVRLLIHCLDSTPDIDGAAGWCWILTRDEASGRPLWMPSVGNFEAGTLKLLPTRLNDLYADDASPKTIEWSGFPTLLMRYSATERLGIAAFQPVFTESNMFGFTGEDISFFACAMSAGLKFVVVPSAKIPHIKFRELEPDYLIGPNASSSATEVMERAREQRNGPRVERSEVTKQFMGVGV